MPSQSSVHLDCFMCTCIVSIVHITVERNNTGKLDCSIHSIIELQQRNGAASSEFYS